MVGSHTSRWRQRRVLHPESSPWKMFKKHFFFLVLKKRKEEKVKEKGRNHQIAGSHEAYVWCWHCHGLVVQAWEAGLTARLPSLACQDMTLSCPSRGGGEHTTFLLLNGFSATSQMHTPSHSGLGVRGQ